MDTETIRCSQSQSYRVQYIDVAKVLVTFLVVFGHLYSPEADTSIIRRYIYTFHMPFFFFISGIFHKFVKERPFENLAKYVKTIIVPAIFFILVFIMVIPPLFGVIDDGGNYFVLLFGAFKTQTNELLATTHLYYNQVCWFLLCLFWCKVFTDILYWKKEIAIIVIFLSLAVCWYFHTSILYIIQAVISMPFYVLGNKCKMLLNSVVFIKHKLLIALLLGILCYSLMLFNGRVSLLGHRFGNLPIPINVFCFYLNALIGSLMIIFFSTSITRVPAIVTNVSKSLITVVGLQAFFFHPVLHWFDGYNLNVFIKIGLLI